MGIFIPYVVEATMTRTYSIRGWPFLSPEGELFLYRHPRVWGWICHEAAARPTLVVESLSPTLSYSLLLSLRREKPLDIAFFRRFVNDSRISLRYDPKDAMALLKVFYGVDLFIRRCHVITLQTRE